MAKPKTVFCFTTLSVQDQYRYKDDKNHNLHKMDGINFSLGGVHFTH